MKITLIMAMTVDGYIAHNSTHNSMEWTSAEDKKLFRTLSTQAGVIIMGQKTYDTIGKPLPNRLTIVLTTEPREDQPGSLEHRQGDLTKIILELKDRGFKEVLIAGGTFVNSQFLKAHLIDELQLTIEPRLFGSGLRLIDLEDTETRLELMGMQKLNDHTIHLTYKVLK